MTSHEPCGIEVPVMRRADGEKMRIGVQFHTFTNGRMRAPSTTHSFVKRDFSLWLTPEALWSECLVYAVDSVDMDECIAVRDWLASWVERERAATARDNNRECS